MRPPAKAIEQRQEFGRPRSHRLSAERGGRHHWCRHQHPAAAEINRPVKGEPRTARARGWRAPVVSRFETLQLRRPEGRLFNPFLPRHPGERTRMAGCPEVQT